jgi:hypothetical protein
LIDIYDRRQFLDEKIAAMDLWSREIKEALEVRQSPSADVVTLPRDRKGMAKIRKGMAKIMGSRPM